MARVKRSPWQRKVALALVRYMICTDGVWWRDPAATVVIHSAKSLMPAFYLSASPFHNEATVAVWMPRDALNALRALPHARRNGSKIMRRYTPARRTEVPIWPDLER